MDVKSLEDIIRQHVSLPYRPRNGGWYSVLCKVCNDHGRKGKRAGFKFEGESVGYNCFNCGASGSYDPNTHKLIPKKMKEILTAFNISEQEWQQAQFKNYDKQQTPFEKQKQYQPKEIELPSIFVPLEKCDNEWSSYAISYLKNQRLINYEDYPFYICNEKPNEKHLQKWYGRLIIPIYKDNKLIFYQGRDLSEKRQQKYLSCETERSNVLYGFEHLFENIDSPLYICEGFFDAYHLNGIAVFGKHISEEQLYWINKSPKKKVIVPDKFGDGDQLAKQGLDLGWSLSLPDWPGCKDVNDAVVKYGLLYVLQTTKDSTHNDKFSAELNMKFYFQGTNKNGTKTRRTTIESR